MTTMPLYQQVGEMKGRIAELEAEVSMLRRSQSDLQSEIDTRGQAIRALISAKNTLYWEAARLRDGLTFYATGEHLRWTLGSDKEYYEQSRRVAQQQKVWARPDDVGIDQVEDGCFARKMISEADKP